VDVGNQAVPWFFVLFQSSLWHMGNGLLCGRMTYQNLSINSCLILFCLTAEGGRKHEAEEPRVAERKKKKKSTVESRKGRYNIYWAKGQRDGVPPRRQYFRVKDRTIKRQITLRYSESIKGKMKLYFVKKLCLNKMMCERSILVWGLQNQQQRERKRINRGERVTVCLCVTDQKENYFQI